MGITIYISDYEIAEKQLSLLQFTYPCEPVSQYATFLPLPLSHEVELHHGRKKS